MSGLDRTGGCLCGAVRFTVRLDGETISACHCDQCRHWTGGPMIVAQARREAVTWQGADNIEAFASSDWAERAFCRRCGSTLYYRITLAEGPMAGTIHLALGALDDISGLTLEHELFADRAAGAYAFAGDHQRLSAAETVAMFAGTGG